MKIVDKRMFHTSSVNPQELGLLCENYCKDELPPLKVPSARRRNFAAPLRMRARSVWKEAKKGQMKSMMYKKHRG